MFRYKSAKNNGNYLCVKIPMNINYIRTGNDNEENIAVNLTEYTLVFSLFGGEHTALARFEMGNIGDDILIGETIVQYAYSSNTIRICDYNYEHNEEYYEAPPHYTRPFFNLYRQIQSSNVRADEQPMFTVSSDNRINTDKNKSALYNTLYEPVKQQLRTIYNSLIEAASEAGIMISIHIDNIIYRDDKNNIVGGTYVGIIPNATGYFYNVSGSTNDPLPGGASWIGYYHSRVDAYRTGPPATLWGHPLPHPQATGGPGLPGNPGHRYCSAVNVGRDCTNLNVKSNGQPRVHAPYTIYVGGHILVNIANPAGGARISPGPAGMPLVWLTSVAGANLAHHTIPLNPAPPPAYDPGFEYYMLPICNAHNNAHTCIMRMTNALVAGGGGGEDVLVLNNFMQ